jgi:hypothetical protein
MERRNVARQTGSQGGSLKTWGIDRIVPSGRLIPPSREREGNHHQTCSSIHSPFLALPMVGCVEEVGRRPSAFGD